ncbi:MAG: LmeA family phospholipid-binding protein [Armatimonadota bacterium]
MSILIALFLFGTLRLKIPSDEDLARGIEQALTTQLHPNKVQVIVQRRSNFSTTIDHLEIVLTGFTADNLFPAASPAVPAAPADAVAPRKPDTRQVRVTDADVTCQSFTAGSLPIKEMAWELRDVRIPYADAKAGKLTITGAQSATGHITLQQEALADFLRTRKLPIEVTGVAITPEGVKVSGVMRSFIRVPVEVTGRIVVKDQSMLYLNEPKLNVSVVKVPDMLAKRLLEDINPLFTLNQDLHLPAPASVDSVSHGNGTLRFDIALHFPTPEKP